MEDSQVIDEPDESLFDSSTTASEVTATTDGTSSFLKKLTCEDVPLKAAQNKIISGMDELCKKHGGPAQYLASQLPSQKLREEFLWHLMEKYPEADTHFYTTCAQLPPVQMDDLGSTTPLCVHVGVLGFDLTCSMKPPPGHQRTMALVEQMVVDGFSTNSDPLLVVQSREIADDVKVLAPWVSSDRKQEPVTPFSVGYLKGMLRACTVLAMVHWCWKNDLPLDVHLPILAKSICTVYIHHAQQSSRVDECLQNMKVSSRGSLRKMTNVIEIVFMIKGLCNFGLDDFASFLRRWNQMSARSHQIVGKRAVAIKLLFDTAPKAAQFKNQWGEAPVSAKLFLAGLVRIYIGVKPQ